MNRTRFWLILGLGSLLGVSLISNALLKAASWPGQTPLNVLFIVIDDLRPNLGCYNDSLAQTPHIDQLTRRGLVFNRAHCQQAVCAPSRASMLTGLRPDSIRVWDLNTPLRTHLPDLVTLPQHFKQQGYITQCIGKIFHDPADHQDPVSWSVPEQWHVTDEAGGKYVLAENSRNGGKGFWKAAPTERAEVADSAYVDGKVALTAVRALQGLRSHPFFLAVGFRRPHLPFSAPEQYWQRHRPEPFARPVNEQLPQGAPVFAGHSSAELRGYTAIPAQGEIPSALQQQLRQGYYASISYVDAQVGLVLRELKRLGLVDKTVVVVVSDHGFHLGEQGLWTKTSNYELDVRVPLIVSVPRQKAVGQRTDALVELIDLFPTLTDVCALTPPRQTQGQSFKKLLDQPRREHRSIAISQFPRPWPYKNAPQLMGYSVRTKRYRYTEWRGWEDGRVQASELYDLGSDPIERTNVSHQAAFAQTQQQLARALHTLIPGPVNR